MAIGRALLRQPSVLILDEATSALDVATRDRLFAIVARLTAAGGAVLFISHRMDEVAEIADRVTVLRSGESVATLDRADADPARLVELMTGGEQLVQAQAAAPAVAAAGEIRPARRRPGPAGRRDRRAGRPGGPRAGRVPAGAR